MIEINAITPHYFYVVDFMASKTFLNLAFVAVFAWLFTPAISNAQEISVARTAPALWEVRDTDTILYLFGTVHILKPGANWRTPVIDQALDSAAEVWLEADDPDPAALQPLIMELGVDAANPLPRKLTEDEKAQLLAATTSIGMPPNALDPMRPWLAALTLAVVPIVQAGYDPALGVDKAVRTAAAEAGTPVRTFETAQQQMRFFADMPEELQMQLLRNAFEDLEEGPAMVDRLAAAWASGDVAAIEEIMLAGLRAEAEELYRILIVGRNAAWAETLNDRLEEPGIAFVAVGAGHLVGPDSLQSMLEGEGVTITRVQ